MPPKGYTTITIPTDLARRLRRMKKGQRFDSIGDCIEYLLKFTVW